LLAAGAVQFLETLDAASEWEARKALLRANPPPFVAADANRRVPHERAVAAHHRQ
jgi:hypothetical protein